MYLNLFLTFMKIGAFAFGGGYAVLPLIEQYVVRDNRWLTTAGLTDLVSISQMTPGPIAINSATFIGTKVAGVPGAIVATLGNVLPQFLLMMILGYFIFSGRKLRFLDHILLALKPSIVGLIAIATISMFQSSLYNAQQWSLTDWNWFGVAGLVLGLALYGTKKLDVGKLVLVSAATGLVLCGLTMLF